MNLKISRKIILIFVLALLLSVGAAGSFAKETIFSDVGKDHWAYESINMMYEEGIIAGYPDGSFKPSKDVSYGEFIKMLTVAAGTANEREDSRGNHWALVYYQAALDNFFFSQWDISEKKLDMPMPRKDMALAVSGALGKEIRISDYGDYRQLMENINDIDPRHSHEFHIIKAYATGILTGYPDGSFRPDGVLTRAEAASVIWRAKALLADRIQNIEEQEEDIDFEEVEVLVRKVVNPTGYPKGSTEYILTDHYENTQNKYEELKSLLVTDFPEYGLEIFKTFEEFLAKPISQGGFGIRKQYFGEIPVFMEHMTRSATIGIYPKGYLDPFWDLKPGQVDETIK